MPLWAGEIATKNSREVAKISTSLSPIVSPKSRLRCDGNVVQRRPYFRNISCKYDRFTPAIRDALEMLPSQRAMRTRR